jgi:predicted PurR-regulated permease PerM
MFQIDPNSPLTYVLTVAVMILVGVIIKFIHASFQKVVDTLDRIVGKVDKHEQDIKVLRERDRQAEANNEKLLQMLESNMHQMLEVLKNRG